MAKSGLVNCCLFLAYGKKTAVVIVKVHEALWYM